MPSVSRFRSIWGVPAGDNYENWAKWFPTLKAQGYGMILCIWLTSLSIDSFSVGVEIDIAPFKSLAPIREICDKVGLEINVL